MIIQTDGLFKIKIVFYMKDDITVNKITGIQLKDGDILTSINLNSSMNSIYFEIKGFKIHENHLSTVINIDFESDELAKACFYKLCNNEDITDEIIKKFLPEHII